jgi:glycosyltransferase involved in cell wall biosynthesis
MPARVDASQKHYAPGHRRENSLATAMRIALSIHHHLDRDAGAAGVTLRLADAYRERGHEVALVSFDDLPRGLPDLGKEQLFPALAAWRLGSTRKSPPPDVIDASTGDAWVWALRRGRAGGPVLVTRSHGLEHASWRETLPEARANGQRLGWRTSLAHGRFRKWQIEVSLRRADACLFLNRDDLEEAVRDFDVDAERAHVVHNGLADEFLGLEPGPTTAPVRIACVGAWSVAKGSRYLAKALATLLSADPSLGVTLVGTGGAREEVLRDLPAGVHEQVRVVPSYAHGTLPAQLRDHEIAVTASVAEGFGLAILEAMACGLAPVASSLRGTREFVRDGGNGVLVPPRDPDALVAAILGLLADPSRLDALRRAAWQDAQSFGWEPIVEHTLDVYETALIRRRRVDHDGATRLRGAR